MVRWHRIDCRLAVIGKMGNAQRRVFQLDDPVLSEIKDEIKGIDIDNLTPMQALNKLQEIKKILGERG